MADFKSLERLQLLHPSIRDKAIDAYNYAVKKTPIGVHPYITQTIRSFEESDRLYKLGRTVVNHDGKSAKKPFGNIVSNAKAGQSYHNYGLALDFVLLVNGKEDWNVGINWMVVVNIFKAAGFKWGGDFKSFKDYPHFEMSLGYSVSNLFELYKENKFIPGTKFLDI